MRMLVFLALLAGGCGDSANQLTGSLSEIYSLDFDSVRLRLVGDNPQYFTVEYLKGPGGAQGTTAKLVTNLSGVSLGPGTITLTDMVGGLPRGTLQRIGDTTIDLPIQTGTLVLDQTIAAGASLSGHFNTTLSMPSGRTLNGTFSATVERVQ